MRRSKSSSPQLIALVAILALTLVSGWLAAAPAQAEKPLKGLKAITAFDSKTSSLRRGPTGKPLSAKEKKARHSKSALRALSVADGGSLGNSDQMGAPADKTVLRSDQVLRERNTSGQGEGNVTTISQYALKSDMSGIDGTPGSSPTSERATIDHRYPSVHGHFLMSTQESVLQFKQSVAGSDAIYKLATADAAAQKWTYDSGLDPIDTVNGGTYVIKTGGDTAITNVGANNSSAVNTPPQLAAIAANTATPAYAQQWGIIPRGGNWFQLISRADGLCIAHPGNDALPPVTSAECSGDPTTLWRASSDDQHLWSFHLSDDSNSQGLVSVGNTLGLAQNPQSWEIHHVSEPGGPVPTWSTVRAKGYTVGQIAAPYAMGAGDLDGIATPDATESAPGYHDEAVVAYTDSNNNWAVRVIDYNAGEGRLLVTAPDPSIKFGQTGDVENDIRNPGDLVVDIGDFDGDGRNEIATAFQESGGDFQWTFWRYNAGSDGSRTLKMLSDCLGCGGTPFKATDNIAKQQGYASSAVGDFDGDGRDDIALAYVNNVATTTANSGRKANLGVWTLNPDLSTRSVDIIAPGAGDDTMDLPPSVTNDAGRASSGLELVAGNLVSDPANGFGPQRSELALAWAADHVGDHVYNPNTTKDEHPYTIQPVVNIYSAATSDCNNTGTTCDIALSPTNGQNAPQPLFPSNPSQTAYRNFGTGYNPPPISLAVGTFGGTDPSDPPVDGLLASAWLEWNEKPDAGGTGTAYYTQQSIVVPWVSGDDTHTKWTINDAQQAGHANWVLDRYTGYDATGASMVLGAPSVLNLEQNIKEDVVAAEPPTQVDWLNGGWSNVSATSDFYLETKSETGQAFTSSTSNENSWNTGVHESFDEKVTFTEPIGPVQEKSYLDVNQKFEKNWSGLSQTSTNASSSWSSTASAQTNQDDMISYSADDTVLYRYPVIGKPGQVTGSNDCTSGCRAYYDVYIPQGSLHFDKVGGKATSFFQPAWSNMNALSYPAIDSGASNPVPMPDLGSYSYTDDKGQLQTVQKPLYNQVNSISGNNSSIELDFSSAAGSGTTTSHSRSFKVGADLTLSGKVELDTPLGDGSFKTTASSGFDVTKTTASTATGTSATSSAQTFTINVPQSIDPGEGYNLGTTYYFSSDGAAKVVHGVDLTGNSQGKNWWHNNYGQTPDPALNLPGRIGLTYDSTNGQKDKPVWLTSPQRQLIRGFQVLQTADDVSGLPTAGLPYTVNPKGGQSIVFQAPVSNYSLKDMPNGITATWYYVAVANDDQDVVGSLVKIGTSDVPAIPAQGAVQVQSPTWKPPSSPLPTMQQYRIVLRLDEAGAAPDMHPLAGDACPVDSLEASGNNTTPALYDVTAKGQVADPLGCGQDNQGYGLVTVDPAQGTANADRHATSADPARAQLAGGGLIDGNPDHLTLTEKSDVPTIPVGDRITGLVRASAKLHTGDHPLVAVYDGPVSDGKIVAITRMSGINDKTGGSAAFTWTPDQPGLHELHQVLLGTAATGEDDEQIMRVNVAQPLDQFTVTVKSSASTIKPGGAFTISGKATPVATKAVYRLVQLQRKTENRWTKVDEQQTSSTGAYAFELTAGKAGKEVYRVYKVQSPGRSAVASSELTVTVAVPQQKFTVTAKAKPTKVRRGKKTTISGKVTPALPVAAQRRIELQIKKGTTWKKVTTTSTKASGAYVITVKPTKLGKLSYRVVKLAAAGRPNAYSPSVRITVKR